MTLIEAIKQAGFTKTFRRKSWTHQDVLYVLGHPKAYGGGEIMWQASGTRAQFFYVNEITGDDWEVLD